MSNDYGWRRRFIEVIEEVFRELHFEPPAMTHDPDTSLVMELEVDGTIFEVVHNPRTNGKHCLMEARLGNIATDAPDDVLIGLLVKNLELAKNFSGTFSGDIKDNAVLYSASLPLDQASGAALLQAMRETAVMACEWRLTLSGAEVGKPGAMGHVSSALA
nr:CesT family type III secretion system chaperone [uncultured Noviherbaspirillum sp.]